MIDFNAGTYKGTGKLMKLSTYRDGGLGFPIRVDNTPDASILLANVNKICRFTFRVDGGEYQSEGELAKLSTYKNGGIGLDIVVPNEPRGGAFLLAHDKKSGDVVFEFSSVKGKGLPRASDDEDEEDEELGQQGLDFLSDAAADGGPVEGVNATDTPEDLEDQ